MILCGSFVSFPHVEVVNMKCGGGVLCVKAAMGSCWAVGVSMSV